MNSIYIAGAVGDDPDYDRKFATAEKNLIGTFDGKVINPVRMLKNEFITPEEVSWDVLMLSCLKALSECTHIYLLPDYYKSTGACIELMWAQKLNLVIIRESDKEAA